MSGAIGGLRVLTSWHELASTTHDRHAACPLPEDGTALDYVSCRQAEAGTVRSDLSGLEGCPLAYAQLARKKTGSHEGGPVFDSPAAGQSSMPGTSAYDPGRFYLVLLLFFPAKALTASRPIAGSSVKKPSIPVLR